MLPDKVPLHKTSRHLGPTTYSFPTLEILISIDLIVDLPNSQDHTAMLIVMDLFKMFCFVLC